MIAAELDVAALEQALARLAQAATVVIGVLLARAKRSADRAAGEASRAGQRVEQVAQRVGEPNGAADVVTMLGSIHQAVSSLVEGQAVQDRRIAAAEAGIVELRAEVSRPAASELEGRAKTAELAGRVAVLETQHNQHPPDAPADNGREQTP